MMKKLIYLALCAALFTGCCQIKQKRVAEHVILIGLDGWTSRSLQSISPQEIPNITALMEQGSWTVKKRSVLPSESAVNWATMFMGADSEIHGFTTWSSRVPEIPSAELNGHGIFPTIFSLLREQEPDAEIGCLYDWEGIKFVVDSLALSHFAQSPDYEKIPNGLCDMAVRYIDEKKPRLLAVISDALDHVGHTVGFDSLQYRQELIRQDGYVGRIVQAVKDAGLWDDAVIIVTSDHGGIGTRHGGKTLEEMETPFIIAGKGVCSGKQMQGCMMQYDIAATIARILNVATPPVWIGRAEMQVFE